MTYEQTLSAIHSRGMFSQTAGLERITRLMARLGNPQEGYPCIHIAGTNGKGSVSAMVEAALRQGGYRVGLFTSPYLVDFRERIQINRKMIEKEQLITCYELVMAEQQALEEEGYPPVNEFELVTAMGLVAFAREKVDYAVIEVGLGGRCDSTNVITHPAVCGITPIDMDHTGVLGNTLSAIAGEKAGIIKPGCPVVTAHQAPEAMPVLEEQARLCGSTLIRVQQGEGCTCDADGTTFCYRGEEISLPLLGKYQAENGALAWEICRLLGLEKHVIRQGLGAVSWPGRLQRVGTDPEFLIDAGHNPAGVAALCEALDTLFPGRRIVAIMAMMEDKDYVQCIPMVAKRAELVVATTVSLPRSLSPERLQAEAEAYTEVTVAESVPAAITMVKTQAPEDALVVVCGSVYAAGAAIECLQTEEIHVEGNSI